MVLRFRERLDAGDRRANVVAGAELGRRARYRRARELSAARRVGTEGAIEVLTQLDALVRPGAPHTQWRELQHGAVEAHGVVTGDEAAVLEAADALDRLPRRERPPGGGGIGGQDPQARGVPRQGARQETGALLDRGHPPEAQAPPHTILEGAGEAPPPTPCLP